MNGQTIEDTCGRVASYLYQRCFDLPTSETRHAVFLVGELAERTGTSPRMIGKLRKRFRRALAQGMTPGRTPEFEIVEQSCFGKAAIAVRRVRPAPNE